MNLGFTNYRTQNSSYHPFSVKGHDAIIPREGEYAGKKYLIIGFLAPERKLIVSRGEKNLEFRLMNERGELKQLIPGRRVHRYLEKTPKRGRRIVGRLIGEKDRLVSSKEANIFLITGPIEKIFPEPRSEAYPT